MNTPHTPKTSHMTASTPLHPADPDSTAQQLSALADGELEAGAARFLLKRVEHDQDLRARWGRYHVAQACLRRAPLQLMPAGFAARVAAALEAERHPRRMAAPLLRWAGGAAVAASVAVLALLAAQPAGGPTATPGVEAPAQVAASTGAVREAPLREQDLRPDFSRIPAQTVAATQTRDLGAAPAMLTDPRIEDYLVRHNQALQAQGRASFVPYVYVVAQPAEGTVRALPVSGSTR